MLYCFLDTNIFLQYQPFDEIDWPKILNATKVCLVIPKKVIQELDKHKNDPISERRKKRAATALKKILEYQTKFQGAVRANVTLKGETVAPKADWLELHGYDPTDADDCIVGAVHYFKLDDPNTELLLFSGDYGIQLKAHANDIPFVVPPDEIKLPPEPDPQQQENLRLQRELLRFQNAQPKLLIEFEDEKGNRSNIVDFQVNFEEIELLETDINQQLARQFALLQYDDEIDGEFSSSNDNLGSISVVALTLGNLTGKTYPSRKEIDNYHESLNKFLQNEYRDYLREFQVYKNRERLTRSITLVLNNEGTSPAKNVDVWLHFPDGIQVFEEILSEPFEPPPPVKPEISSMYDSFLIDNLIDSNFLLNNINSSNYPSEPSGPFLSIRKTNSYEIEWGPLDLKHNLESELPELYLLFKPIDTVTTGFEIEYEITADNLMDVVKGKLIIRLRR